MKWTQQYEGPYLILKMLSPLVAKIQQSSRAKPKIVHIDKLKKYEGMEPRMWSTAVVAVDAQRDGGQKGATGPYIPSSSENERSNSAVSARTLGEVHIFQGRESVDGLTAPPSTQKTENVQELLCPEQTRSLEPLVSTDESASQAVKLTETSGLNLESCPLAVVEFAVEDSSMPMPNDSEATTPVVPVKALTRAETGVYPNSDPGSPFIITENKSETQGAPYPVTSSVTGHPVASLSACGMSLGSNADTNVTTPVAGTELGVQTGQRASSSYENSAKLCVQRPLVWKIEPGKAAVTDRGSTLTWKMWNVKYANCR